jgi:hypothetical protein
VTSRIIDAKNSFRITRKTRFLKKAGFSGPFRQKLLSFSKITLMLFRTLSVASGCNKVSENEKTSGNRYMCCNGNVIRGNPLGEELPLKTIYCCIGY